MIKPTKFYNARAQGLSDTDFLKQVGHTINGAPISDIDLNLLVEGCRDLLQLTPTSNLLDLCCGNGLITKHLSAHCNSVCGIDISSELIRIAKSQNHDKKISYHANDIWALAKLNTYKHQFSHVMIFASLQHFKSSDLPKLLALMSEVSTKDSVFLLGFLPDISRRWRFYNTIKKKLLHVFRRVTRTDLMGTWWDKNIIINACKSNGYSCRFHNIPSNQYGGEYRFHVTITRSPPPLKG